jgi:hypothetical protein
MRKVLVGKIRVRSVLLTLTGMIVASCSPAQVVAQEADLSFLQTRAEASDYEQTTGYDEAIGFLEVAAAQSSDLHLTHFGYSVEGRKLPLVVWGTESAHPETLKDDPRLRIFIQANIHAGEVCGKDAMLALIRDLASGRYESWKESVVLVVAPVYNVDGNERVSLYNRPRQNGPVGGMGQRPNAQNLDLNRDHMKLASPEARSLVGMMNAYDPHVLIDLHTTNGTRHGYHLTYSPPLNPNTDPAIDGLLRNELLPDVTSSIRDRKGWEFYYYGNLPFRSGNRGWYTFDHRPRFNNNYVGLRNRVAILSEAYAYAPYKERVLASRAFVEEIVTWSASNASKIRTAITHASEQDLAGTPFGVRAAHKASEAPVDILLGEADMVRNPYSGAAMLSMTEETRIESMTEYGSFAATETVTLPANYVVLPGARGVQDLLDDHGIRYQVTSEASSAFGERFAIDSTQVSERPFQGVQERTLFGRYVAGDLDIPVGAVVVPVNQPLGRLAAYLLEARSDDGILNWGKVDRYVEENNAYPVLRLPVVTSGQ